MKQDLVNAIENVVRGLMNDMHTAMPGKIVEYSEGLVTVQPSLKYTKPDGERLEYPLLSNVPIVITCGGNASVAVPIKPGDDCLIIISEQALDEWLADAEDDMNLRYDLTNAICVPGLSKASIEAQEEANRKGTVVISCPSGSAVTVRGDLKVEGNIFYAKEILKQ